MDYFKILNLNREPFSNSPEPELFFLSTEHLACLQQLELAIRLRRGLNVVMGDVGMGKTTLCRQLILRFTESEADSTEVQTHLLLDPTFSTTREFLSTVAATFGLPGGEAAESEWHLKENIKNYLFQKGVDEKKTVVLIIDEGQKLPGFCREVLREFLNFETNENKLLQIVIFAQNEFGRILKRHANFADRVNQFTFLKPLNFRETKALIRFRLSRSGRPTEMPALFTLPGLWAVYLATDGYPRRIITLCHQVLLTLIIQNKTKAGWTIVRSTTGRLLPDSIRKRRWVAAGILAGLALALSAIPLFLREPSKIIKPAEPSVQSFQNQTKSIVSDESAAEAPEIAAVGLPHIQPEGSLTVNLPASALTAPEETVQKGSQRAPESHPKPPVLLGSLKIRQGDEVLRFLLEIYGNTETNRFQAVILANPHIIDMNRVIPGEAITFPAIPAAAQILTTAGYWVQIAKKDNLEEAYRIFKTYPQEQLPIRLVPSWNKRDGLAFTIVLKRGFPNEEAAKVAIGNLPPKFAATAEIMKTPEKGTVYFTY
jgi:general secretion pathway protein A